MQSLSTIASSDASGEIRIWNLTTRKCVTSWAAHNGVVRGTVFGPSGKLCRLLGILAKFYCFRIILDVGWRRQNHQNMECRGGSMV